ncbi:DUF4124 domain-containing protein [Herminiimonas sp. CN]|uniref:DUF4124 domain-containing protein n=1 Tax=Herminiimonas sp. CN TaxID=1349818 RepID=UPI000473AF6D|nr:DUF4124 domain-containing protein [Herminiimonas sp. CN]
MKQQFVALMRALTLCAAAIGYAHAQSEVYLCIDENGKKEYKNTGATKGCKKIDLPGITTFAAPPVKAPAAVSGGKPAPATPADFPKVDGNTQKERDNDRRQILQKELKAEQQKLDSLKKEYNNGQPERLGSERNYAKYQERVKEMQENIHRSERNVEALNREIGNMK